MATADDFQTRLAAKIDAVNQQSASRDDENIKANGFAPRTQPTVTQRADAVRESSNASTGADATDVAPHVAKVVADANRVDASQSAKPSPKHESAGGALSAFLGGIFGKK